MHRLGPQFPRPAPLIICVVIDSHVNDDDLYMYVFMYVCIYVCMYVYTYVCMACDLLLPKNKEGEGIAGADGVGHTVDGACDLHGPMWIKR